MKRNNAALLCLLYCFSLTGCSLLYAMMYDKHHYPPIPLYDTKSTIENNFIQSVYDEEAREGARSQGSFLADLDKDGKDEFVIVWTTLGPTYWHNTLTILSEMNSTYAPIASYQLIGEAKLAAIKNEKIIINQKIYADGDPRCCPTIEKQIVYLWDKKENKVIELQE